MKSWKSLEKNETKNIKLIVFIFLSSLTFWCFLLYFFMWFAGFQILICEPQSNWRKLLVLSWLYSALVHYFVFISSFLEVKNVYNKLWIFFRYHLKDVIVGKIYFLLVRIKIRHMEVAIIKRETTGAGPNTFHDNETIAK